MIDRLKVLDQQLVEELIRGGFADPALAAGEIRLNLTVGRLIELMQAAASPAMKLAEDLDTEKRAHRRTARHLVYATYAACALASGLAAALMALFSR